jgi:MFS family permease
VAANGRLGVSVAAFRAVRSNRSLRLVQAARLASVTGRWAYTVSLAVFAYREGGAAGVAAAAIVRLAPAALAAPFAGALVHRFRSDRVLLTGGLARAAFIGAAGALALHDSAAWTVYACVAVDSAVSAVLRPVQQSLLPGLARTPEELTSTNLALSVIESMGVLIGPLCGAVLLHAASIGFVFVAAAAAYLVSAVLLAAVSTVGSEPPVEIDSTSGLAIVREAVAGLHDVGRDRDVQVVLFLYGAENVVAGALNVLLVVTALRLLGLGQAGVGTFTAAIGAGGILGGAVVLSRLGRRAHGADLGVGLVLFGVPLLLLAVFSSTVLALVLLGIVGVGVTVVDVAAVSLLQRALRGDLLAHAFGLLQALFVVTVGIGTVLAPILVDLIGVRGALVAAGLPLPILAAALWRRLRSLDAALGPESESKWEPLLAGTSIFAPVAQAARERLADLLRERPVTVGEVIVRQGDHGDEFFLIASGAFEVEVDGRTVTTLGTGDFFGEIALLRDVPRTATVRAAADGLLLTLDRAPFLATVAGERGSASAAEAVVGSRLGMRGALA